MSPLAASAQARTVICPGTNVTVNYDDMGDLESACQGARLAVEFLKRNGLDTSTTLQINLVPQIPECRIKNAYGCFNKKSGNIYVLSYWVCCGEGSAIELFGFPVDRALYRSLIVHEVAHAIASHNFSISQPAWIAHEYIAHVTQFATLPHAYRDNVMRHSPGKGFQTEAQINATILLMKPDVFTLQSYRHYMKPEHGRQFIKRLLSGDVQLAHGP